MPNPFFEHPILNSPYECPQRHWELDEHGQPTQRILEHRRRAEFITPIPKPKKRRAAAVQPSLVFDEGKGLSTKDQEYDASSNIGEIRKQVEIWRSRPSNEWQVTPETARLLQHWRQHQFSSFRPFFCQVEAVETAIWLTEVAPETKTGKRFLDHLAAVSKEANPELLRLALKLATGAGKTTVMAMLIAWQTINAARHPGSKRFTRGFLVVAPGLTIKDRLRVLQPNDPDSYYASRELVPGDMLDDINRAKIVITNYHAFKLRERLELSAGGRALLQGRGEELNTKETEGQMLQRVMPDLMGMKNILVLNDEAHHCYREKAKEADDEDLKGDERKEAEKNNEAARLWISGLEAVNRTLGVTRVIDLSATPFFLRGSGYAEGTLFPWTASDFSLMDAIECGIVKLPRVPVAENIPGNEMPIFRNLWENIRKDMPKKGRGKSNELDPLELPARLQTALQALYGHYEKTFHLWQQKGIKVPPCFIIVCQNTAISKLVYDFISGFQRTNEDGSSTLENGRLALFRNFDESTGNPLPRPNTLLIDSEQLEAGDALDANFRAMAGDEIDRFRREITERTGDQRNADSITDQELLREVMNTVGKPGQLGGFIRCVVSVSMLTEGWDANTVTHVLGIRAFGTQLLCEQVIGRALRRQSYELNEDGPDKGLFNVEIAGADIIPATQLYTEDYMVKFLVQNSLGATWMGMHPDSKLPLPSGGEGPGEGAGWEYYVKDADRAPVEKKPVREITFLDPACGSGHFHLEAFDLFYAMYQEEGELTAPEEICNAILTKNLFGIDIDPRAVQIAEVALWMKAAERAFDYKGVPTNLVAATSSHLKGEAWEEFLAGFEREPSVARVLRSFARTMEHIDEIGSLARPAEDLREIIKEEHATWERQVSEKKEANFLFPEMNVAAVSGQLPFHEISDEEFGDRLFYRAKAGIDAFTERARASGEFEDQMIGSETRAGFRLVDLLSRRYDVVAANPPYMGSKNMGNVVARYLSNEYSAGRRDLYAAFLIRSSQLSGMTGSVATITPQSWMFLNSFAQLRLVNPTRLEPKASWRGILAEVHLQVIAQLGRHAFSEADPPSNVVLTIWRQGQPTSTVRTTCIRLSTSRVAAEQDRLLLAAATGNAPQICFRPRQKDFWDVPGAPLCYWLSEQLFVLLKASDRTRLGRIAHIKDGISSGGTARALRFFWEVPCDGLAHRWLLHQKGGWYSKWTGTETYLIDYRADGIVIRNQVGGFIRNAIFFGKAGLVYNRMARGTLGVRLFTDSTFDTATRAIFPHEHSPFTTFELAAILNCRLMTFLLRTLVQGHDFSGGYTEQLPLPQKCDDIEQYSILASKIKTWIISHSLMEMRFQPLVVMQRAQDKSRSFRLSCAILHAVEGLSEQKCFSNFGVETRDRQLVVAETGTPVGWHALLEGYDSIPNSILGNQAALPNTVIKMFAAHERRRMDLQSMDSLRRELRGHFEKGPGEDVENSNGDLEEGDEITDDDEPEVSAGALIPVPPETFVEELSQKLNLHPISVYHLVEECIEKKGWRCLPEERLLLSDAATIITLRLLGYRWPKQIEASEQLPDWADPDGIISITAIVKETTLFESVEQRLRADEIDTSDFAEVMGKPLDAWLATEFFKHHTKQFKKRPIAWQLQSGKFTAKKPPAFACLLYYHKLDADTLPKLQSQYLGPLRQRLETELRGIMAVAADARSDRQVKRRGELEGAILEMQKVDTVLETVARTGFGPQSLFPTIRQKAIDDAMLARKVRWLRRLIELIAKSPLPDWLAAADRTELHPDFRVWIADAMAHLDTYCARVGPKAPDQSKLPSDPIAADLAKLITPHANEMLKDTLELACDQWYAQFDEIVLGPHKDKIKKLKEEQKTCEEKLAADPSPEAAEVRELKHRVKEIKADVKILTAKIKKHAALANTVRAQIESWQSTEPTGWGDWLAGQPLFDRISSLDGRRANPTTIAEFIAQESLYAPDINDGVRVNIAPLQKAGVLAADVLAGKDLDKAIADRAEWRADERRWVREGKLPQPGWWREVDG